MVGPSTEQSTVRKAHRLVEHYTPDSTFGRLLLASATGAFTGSALLFSLFGFGSLGFGWFFVGLLALGLSIVAGLLTVLVLWPVYLSLIGNLDSPQSYGNAKPKSTRIYSTDSVDRTDRADSPDSSNPSEILKRKYAAGELSDEEFERRLDTLLNADETTRRARKSNTSKHVLRE
ncbi:hypothetical protein AUR64_05555 [Haloprofundus marisrubri]|uniref:SHOCT domain-containing protein n=1 Tax=Haloprofundus marisrubri TaxID=1514971 RepID=A0A0W1RCQ0_9EURY|nr:SHOCT domain-containing protein [Haloprofundus marisrubri]KTG11174.1 hypothetical protein AUR64_05555 [Haloprofundus marisrubri]